MFAIRSRARMDMPDVVYAICERRLLSSFGGSHITHLTSMLPMFSQGAGSDRRVGEQDDNFDNGIDR